ncbi:hypothetical protein WICMUC_002963 [Wickerhamomyces mucosus]|uniref:Transcription initiation factor IIF subunit beta n=1 Tax=Wickerhamomyces mucosus TaxID=1378264 RepID=A0A9P8TD00_9ASCO|nr:hypothetical protein WICMUC_002963 [Wickerhamomyces mucosus]
MSAQVKKEETSEVPQSIEEKNQEILLDQQQNEGSDEEYLSDSAEIVDGNDTSFRESLNLDLSNTDQKIWLVRLPRFLAEKWRDKEQLHSQELGKIRIKKTRGVEKSAQIQLKLNNEKHNEDIPHDYTLELTRATVENQYVFTEENLSKFNEQQREREAKNGPLPANDNNDNNNNDDNEYIDNDDKLDEDGIRKTDKITEFENQLDESVHNAKDDLKPLTKRERYFQQRRRRKFNKFKNKDGSDKVIPFVKTIPKKTALVGTVVHECQIIPSIADPNYNKIIEQRKKLIKEEPRPSVTLLNEASGVSLSNAGLTLKTDTSTFLKPVVNKQKNSEGRAIRIPQKELLDLLFKLFDEYDYWSLKGLKERTKQPEIYLKETLDQIAQLIKKGPYIGKWALKKEFKELKDQERAERLGELNTGDNDEEEEEENDEDLEMEDVV